MKKIRNRENKIEVCNYYFSSEAQSPEMAMETLTLETCGDCLGPDDFCNEAAREANGYLSAHWNEAVEMSDAEAEGRISHLAEEWRLAPEELAYLK